MANLKFNSGLLAAASKSVFNRAEWTPTGDAYTLEELWGALGIPYDEIDGEMAEVAITAFEDNLAYRLNVPMKDGSIQELKAGKQVAANYEEGDKVPVSLIFAQELRKTGQPSIVRYDVWASEEAKAEYLAKRG